MSRGIQHLRGASDKPTNLQACEQSELLEALMNSASKPPRFKVLRTLEGGTIR